MNEQERKRLAEKRRQEQQQKEFTNSIAKHLKVEYRNKNLEAISEENDNRYAEALILFLGTLIPLYIFIFLPFWTINFLYGDHLRQVGIHLSAFIPYLHACIWLGSAIGSYRRESLLDTFFDYFTN